MTGLMNSLRFWLHKEEGQGLVEYALILVLIAIAVMATLSVVAGGIDSALQTIASGLGQ